MFLKFLEECFPEQPSQWLLLIIQEKISYKSSRLQMLFKIVVLKYFANFTGKQLCWSLFLMKLPQVCNFSKKRSQHRCFPVKFTKTFKTTFFTEHL